MNKSKKSNLFRTVTVAALSATMLFSVSCGKPQEERHTIAVITKQDISFWADVKSGAEAAGRELGCDIKYDVATSDNDYASQIEYINNAIKDKVDAIVIAPNGDEELNDAFSRAEAAGIKIININSRTSYPGIISCVSSSDVDGGSIAARHSADPVLNVDELMAIFDQNEADMQKVLEYGSGAIAILGHTNAATAQLRIDGYKEECVNQIITEMQRDGVYFEIAGKQATKEQISALFEDFFVEGNRCSTVEASYEEAKKMLTGAGGSKIRAFFSTNTNTTLGVAQAIEETGRTDIYVVGFNSDEQEINYLKGRIIDGLVVQNPYIIGYVGVSYARKAINDDSLPTALDTGVTFVDSDNLNDEYIQFMLHPES